MYKQAIICLKIRFRISLPKLVGCKIILLLGEEFCYNRNLAELLQPACGDIISAIFGSRNSSIAFALSKNSHQNNLEKGLVQACKIGHFGAIKTLVHAGAINFDQGLETACVYGGKKIIRALLKTDIKNYKPAMRAACSAGRISVIWKFKQLGVIEPCMCDCNRLCE